VTPDEIAAYRVAGVVLLRGVLDLSAVNALRRCLDEAAATLSTSPAGYNMSMLTKAAEQGDLEALKAASGGQHDVVGLAEFIKQSGQPLLLDSSAKADGSFLLDTGVAARQKDFKRFCTHGALPEIAGALLESACVNFFGDQIFIKEPGTRERTAFHQDASYFDIEGDQCCVMWIPVDPVTAETGGMMYVRGSHRQVHTYAPNVFVSRTPLPGSEGELLPNLDEHPEDFDIVQFDVEPGDILVHHFKTVHGSGGNLSRYQVRRAASIRYCGDDIRFKAKPGTPRQLHLSTQFQDGDPLSGPDFPIVWRRQRSQDAA
jgi:ectoine hydroxylase-related dioxygenase (phytanoyl-CoA dioxygenase family)